MVPESECLSSQNRIQNCTGLFDTISVCFSKGLRPVGSVLLADKATIAKALRVRKILGGGDDGRLPAQPEFML
jgi:threonine aldolase